MPFSLLIAIFLAFGVDSAPVAGPIAMPELLRRCGEVAGAIAAIGLIAFVLGWWVASRRDRHGSVGPGVRRTFAIGVRLVEWLTLVAFGWIIHGVGWRGVVESGLGLRDAILVDEFLTLLPFLLAQAVGWWGLYAGERALRADRIWARPIAGRGRHLILKARQSLGLVLPVAITFSLGQDVLRRQWPRSAEEPMVQLAWLVAMGAMVLVFAPAFVRLTWPTRPLPPGELRDRLERLARRFRFRCTDILVWDTGQSLVNAGVTGALPWFRYVLLTDALIAQLDEHQVEAVFGHEVGHIAHRHLSYFGFFLLGSVGVMAVVTDCIETYVDPRWLSALASLWPAADAGTATMAIQAVLAVLGLGLYFLLVFGHLSRRFERQADVFGCKAVSCDRRDCPPHADCNAQAGPAPEPGPICPVGIRIFVDALADVAALNGMARDSIWAWRHGSIARRIAFLETLEGRPEAERRFQVGVRRLRVGLAVVLGSALLLAWSTGSLDALR